MITLTVHHPTQEFIKFLHKNKFEYAVETISAYPNREGKYERGTVHIHDYPGNLYNGIIGLSCYWHSIPMHWPLPKGGE